MAIGFELSHAKGFMDEAAFEEEKARAAEVCRHILNDEDKAQVLGWRDIKESAVQLDIMKEKAAEIRKEADAFVIVGVGGSNQSARAVIETMDGGKGPEIIYLGNSLSPHYISNMLKRLDGKKVYIDVIAKNFETLEPGSHFRVLRQWMKEQGYTAEEMKKHIIVTGTRGSNLERMADENGYLFLEFPVPVGGRYSAFTPVGIFPLYAAGLDAEAYLRGAEKAAEQCRKAPLESPAICYAAARQFLYKKGFDIEMLVSFEPQMYYFEKWWWQLFGESEGKSGKGIFPSMAIYSEDLHSMGQYMQQGRRSLQETFLSVKTSDRSVVIEADKAMGDGFDYLDGKDFDEINKAAEEATINAHEKGGVPCMRFIADRIDEEMFGELFYIFMMGCACSGTLMGVNAFDQEGVEEYKRSMFKALGREEQKEIGKQYKKNFYKNIQGCVNSKSA